MGETPKTRFQVGQVEVEVCEGDITRADAEAITNAANNRLWMGAGVAGAIKRAGGPEIEQEAVSKGPIPVGSAVETTAGRLPYKFVLHGAVMGADLQTSADLISCTTRSCLDLAEKLGLKSLALPAFGTGVGGFDITECARLMAAATREFAEASPDHLRRVVFVLWGKDAYDAFLRGVREVLGGEAR
ncbi:MAG: macro domain-containing protein [Armatimonadetes bacterium]|nr:macro domain-containing protein [Armatimonadota bacterium]